METAIITISIIIKLGLGIVGTVEIIHLSKEENTLRRIESLLRLIIVILLIR